MEQAFDNLTFVFPKEKSLEEIQKISPLEIFSEDAISFLDALSKELVSNSEIRNFPDLATFAFFCRKANVIKFKKRYLLEDLIRLGRGLVFHIAPSNVPVNFAYSLFSGILAGNVNVVRVPSKEFEQVNIIANCIERLAIKNEFQLITDRIFLLRYNRISSNTDVLSSVCDVRVIWGGDETINQIRRSKIPAKSYDITFANRYSFCLINADNYLEAKNKNLIAQGFYNDTYLFDQNACTAPHSIIWMGSQESIENAKLLFWQTLEDLVEKNYEDSPAVIAIDKLTAFYTQAIKLNNVTKVKTANNSLWRINLNELSSEIEKYSCSSGYFLEFNIDSFSDLKKIVNRKYQTMAYYGFSKEELSVFFKESNLFGIDRIVPIGRTLDFSLIWDGYDLIRSLSRTCEIV
jgi:hypothetical protein